MAPAPRISGGARILLTTKSANRIIADAYAVRSDYFEEQRRGGKVRAGLLSAQERSRPFCQGRPEGEYNALLASAGQLLMVPPRRPGRGGLYGDAQFAGYQGNVQFFATPQYCAA